MAGASIGKQGLANFKAKWPCHGLPDNMTRLYVCFDTGNYNLLDYTAYYGNGRIIPAERMVAAESSGALKALIDTLGEGFRRNYKKPSNPNAYTLE